MSEAKKQEYLDSPTWKFLYSYLSNFISLIVSNTVTAPLEISKIGIQIGLSATGILTSTQGLLIMIKSNFLQLFIVTFKAFFLKSLQGTKLDRVTWVLGFILVYPLSTMRIFLISDYFGVYKSISEVYNHIIEQGIFRFYHGIFYGIAIIFISRFLYGLLNIYGGFWKRVFTKILYFSGIHLILHPFYTLQYKSQMNQQIFDYTDIFAGIWLVPFIVFVEVIFSSMFNEIGKSILGERTTSLPE